MRLTPNQIKKLVKFIIEELEKDGLLQTMGEAKAMEIIQSIIVNDLKIEEQIEKEAEMLIKKYTTNVHSEELNFDILIRKAKIELAKKRGFKL